jgi:hypothetical protein
MGRNDDHLVIRPEIVRERFETELGPGWRSTEETDQLADIGSSLATHSDRVLGRADLRAVFVVRGRSKGEVLHGGLPLLQRGAAAAPGERAILQGSDRPCRFRDAYPTPEPLRLGHATPDVSGEAVGLSHAWDISRPFDAATSATRAACSGFGSCHGAIIRRNSG